MVRPPNGQFATRCVWYHTSGMNVKPEQGFGAMRLCGAGCGARTLR